jgi:hypothetical protein
VYLERQRLQRWDDGSLADHFGNVRRGPCGERDPHQSRRCHDFK